jgi:hypothetical protein
VGGQAAWRCFLRCLYLRQRAALKARARDMGDMVSSMSNRSANAASPAGGAKPSRASCPMYILIAIAA